MKPTAKDSYILQDEITGDWAIVAPERMHRPFDIERKKKNNDPFAPTAIPKESIIAKYGRGENEMIVMRNAFPVFRRKRGVTGWQEIVVEGRKIIPFCNSTPARIFNLLEAFNERFKVLRQDSKIKYIQAFKNEGILAGASQPHPHSQIFAVSFVPDRLRDAANRRRAATKRLRMTSHRYSLGLATKERIVFSDKNVIAYANPAARFSYEVRILTRRAVDNLTKTKPEERRSLASAVYALLPLMKKRKMSYNFFFHDVLDEADEHFEIRFTPRSNVWGGFELDTGISVNPVPAEFAAEEYKGSGK